MAEWWAVMWNVKPGTEQEVEDLFRNYGRPDTVVKDESGEVVIAELDTKDDPRYAGFAPLLSNRVGLFTSDDLLTIAAGIPERTGALVVLFEHAWAIGIKEALEAKGAILLGRATVPPEVLEAVADELESADTQALPA